MSSSEIYHYPGTELDLFQSATNWKNYFAQSIRPYLGESVLEVGAGIGGTTVILGENQRFQRWLCLEPDQNLCASLAGKVKSLGPSFEARQGTLSALSAEEKFDSILYLDVIEHIEADQAELNRAMNHLKPGGHLIILVPAHNSLFSPFDTASGHFRRYNKKMLKLAVPGALEQRRLIYLDSTGLLLSLANRLLLQQSQPTTKQIQFWDKVIVPISRILDPIFGYQLGKSLVGIWKLN